MAQLLTSRPLTSGCARVQGLVPFGARGDRSTPSWRWAMLIVRDRTGMRRQCARRGPYPARAALERPYISRPGRRSLRTRESPPLFPPLPPLPSAGCEPEIEIFFGSFFLVFLLDNASNMCPDSLYVVLETCPRFSSDVPGVRPLSPTPSQRRPAAPQRGQDLGAAFDRRRGAAFDRRPWCGL
jgi:hypothetical protein